MPPGQLQSLLETRTTRIPAEGQNILGPQAHNDKNNSPIDFHTPVVINLPEYGQLLRYPVL
jgi:hypothetical protein